ncbi:MAG: YqaE/Pmp3 family membrane protein [Chitinophagaceae bacterium]|nr:YqaE/Pmp3 family membrane protein [Chitinophagaceae bacterium]
MTLIAIIFPFLSFMLRGKIFTGILCLILQITIIGWVPAAFWAVISLQNARADRRTDRIVREMRRNNR